MSRYEELVLGMSRALGLGGDREGGNMPPAMLRHSAVPPRHDDRPGRLR